jgi:L-aspartate oxidase
MSHVIVVGSGIAGLIAALEISQKHSVTLVTKAELADSNTRWARGGIAAAMFEDDSVDEHIDDTLRAGAGLCQTLPVKLLCTEGPQRILDLIRLGVVFDTRNGELDRGMEAAHTRARVLHAGGDKTGLAIELALVHRVRSADNIRVREHTFARDIVLENECARGLELLGADGGLERIGADAVVLASGGAGQLYLHTTNPAVATGDGVAMAMRAGAQLADVEFYQFHPTALAAPGTFLISEAVRGEGAVLLDVRGRRFMQALHPDAELAPRDVVARGIVIEMAKQGGVPVLLDATAMGREFLRSRFPSIDAACRRHGFDWSREPIPVTPAAHYWMGGVRTDVWGRTSIRSLYAVGEVACTGVHGANRLASNSLLESLVFAWRSARQVESDSPMAPDGSDWPARTVDSDNIVAVDDQPSRQTINFERRNLQKLMWDVAGIERSGPELEAALADLSRWQTSGESADDLETKNLLQLARVLVAAAIRRQESRGAHFRRDYPLVSHAFAYSLVYRQQVSSRFSRKASAKTVAIGC